MKTIFMTGGGGAGTIAATKFLKNLGKYRIILGDMDRWAAGLKFADKSYILPAAKDERFVDVVRGIIKKENIDVFIPLVDEEILKSYELRKDFPNLLILLPEYDFARMALDKWLLIQKLKEHGFVYPKTQLFSENLEDLEYPLLIKPRRGRGSRNVVIVNSREQLDAYKVLSGLTEEEILIQEKLQGREFTVSVVVDKKGGVRAVVPKEVIYKRGITIVAITRYNYEIQKLCVDIQNKLRPSGPFNVQLFLKNSGIPVIFEINPRYSTTIALTIAAGVNEIDILINDRTYPSNMLSFRENLIMTRFYDQLYLEET